MLSVTSVTRSVGCGAECDKAGQSEGDWADGRSVESLISRESESLPLLVVLLLLTILMQWLV